jgi:hypothetical protein
MAIAFAEIRAGAGTMHLPDLVDPYSRSRDGRGSRTGYGGTVHSHKWIKAVLVTILVTIEEHLPSGFPSYPHAP